MNKFEGDKLPVEPRPDDYPESEPETLSRSDGEPPQQIYQHEIFNELSTFDKVYVDEAQFATTHSWSNEIIPDCTDQQEIICPAPQRSDRNFDGEEASIFEEEPPVVDEM